MSEEFQKLAAAGTMDVGTEGCSQRFWRYGGKNLPTHFLRELEGAGFISYYVEKQGRAGVQTAFVRR